VSIHPDYPKAVVKKIDGLGYLVTLHFNYQSTLTKRWFCFTKWGAERVANRQVKYWTKVKLKVEKQMVLLYPGK